ncbi:MAG: deoxyguanosinetriphosphate triphosphohydrolase [Firmicutes bacterium]|nr:deoxyguanosinetriphosphate triphosphohydrolase [Bacillota bacterium]
MLKREDIERREALLAEGACRSAQSKGRVIYEEPCAYRTEFQRDRDRIIHSKAFRRLMHKTQVFLAPEGDHYRTRLTHTLEVSQIARTIARNLNLNEDLTEAIAMGHDLGHTPFGHNGESVLNDIHPGGFRHNVQSLRVAEVLESTPNRKGMNLTFEVKDGILNHSGSLPAATLEGQIVKISDRIAYINHDIDDAIRSGVISLEDLPKSAIALFGQGHRERIDCMVGNVVSFSDGKEFVTMDAEHKQELDLLRNYMFENVYRSQRVKKEEDLAKVEVVISSLYDYFLKHPEKLPEDIFALADVDGVHVAVKDYIAGMTDRFALNLYGDLFVPKGWR